MGAVDDLDAQAFDAFAHGGDFGIRIGGKAVDRDHRGNTEGFDVVQVATKILTALGHSLDVFVAKFILADAAMHLERANGSDDDGGAGVQPGQAAFDVEELFRPQIGAESGLGDHIIGQPQRRSRRHHRITTVGDVGERATVDKGRVVFQGLDQIGLQGFLQQHRHRPGRLYVDGVDRFALAGIANNNPPDPFLQVGQVCG